MAGNPDRKIKKHKYNEANKKIEFRDQFNKINSVVNGIEENLIKSRLMDSKVLMAIKMDDFKKQQLTTLLEKAEKENKQLLNILQQQGNENDIPRSNSRSNLDYINSYSTVSMVNLQYKYEELVASHQGLLRILESKVKEIKSCNSTCTKLEEQLQILKLNLEDSQHNVNKLCHKFISLKNRKERKISILKNELGSVKQAYDKLLKLLEKQNETRENEILHYLKKSSPFQAKFLQEVRRTNVLKYENVQLKLELEKVRQKLNVRVCKSCMSLPNIKIK